MNERREFFKSAAALGLLSVAGVPLQAATGPAAVPPEEDRRYWLRLMDRIARPVLSHLARRELKVRMPVEQAPGFARANVTHLEAFGRLVYGLAPWLALEETDGDEILLQREFAQLARDGLDAATDPQSPDCMNFTADRQPLVDAAFLAQGILRGWKALWIPLTERVKQQVISALKSTRQIPTPQDNNWVMFAATVEAALLEMGEPTLPERLEDCVRKMSGWYAGDGTYGDGAAFHCDYYNSFVIQPMLVDVLTVLARHDARFAPALAAVVKRARRYAVIQERFIAPDGTYPAIGRSLAYRFGAFQTLALVALRGELPDDLPPAQVRCALTAVLRRSAEAPGTFDANGWLQIGLCGHQPGLGERYISTGSLYLCSAAWLPMGLSPAHGFWRDPPMRWTSQKIWSGEDLPADHALNDERRLPIPRLERSGP
jgi:hypothetical protein